MDENNSPRTLRQNLKVILPIVVLQTTVYVTLNQVHWKTPRPLPLTALDEWFPFWPWTVLPYMAFFLIALPIALVIRTDRVLRQAVLAYFICLALTVPFFVFWPTACPRPDLSTVDDSWDLTAYRWLAAIDSPACSFPSMHIMLPAIVCWAAWAEGKRWARWSAAAMLTLSLTILTTKQHYAWDWFGGLAVAIFALWLSGRLLRISRKPASESGLP